MGLGRVPWGTYHPNGVLADQPQGQVRGNEMNKTIETMMNKFAALGAGYQPFANVEFGSTAPDTVVNVSQDAAERPARETVNA